MVRRLTREEFLDRASAAHGDKYGYELVKYINNHTKVKITCPKHGVFEQAPNNHFQGQGCWACGREIVEAARRYNTESFIERAKEVHGDWYDYSCVEYEVGYKRVEIICPKHGPFFQKPYHHLAGNRCHGCGTDFRADNIRKTTEEFIEDARAVHGNVYRYKKVKYAGCHEPVLIICKKHGIFSQVASDHLRGCGCPTCGDERMGNANRKTREEFIKQSKEMHQDRYDYSLVEYNGSFDKVSILCPEHGRFRQTPHNHIVGGGCPACSLSVGEARIAEYLSQIGISFERQKSFPECTYQSKLFFDFYFEISNQHTLIEYDGRQHFEPISYFGGQEAFENRQQRDAIKNTFAAEHDFTLIRIPYTERDNIESYLLQKLSEATGLKPVQLARHANHVQPTYPIQLSLPLHS